MAHEQVFDKIVDSEQVFVLQCRGSEQVFEQGDAMSVAFELEYEVVHPQLRLVVDRPPRSASRTQFRRRRAASSVSAEIQAGPGTSLFPR